ncbi:MAG TPA: ABC transporter permease, partial [Firmicutes bacterium]|nr:ABC transporter permease [Bacillota bacterium]
AYNSVHMNLKARTRDFALLRSAGMTENQLKKMLGYETFFLIRQVVGYYVLMLALGVWALSAKKHYMFSPWQLALNLNFPLLIFFFVISIVGIWAAMESGRRKVLGQSIIATLQQSY